MVAAADFAPRAIDASGLARLAGDWRENFNASKRDASLARLAAAGSLDPNSVGLALIASGDAQGGLQALHLADQRANTQFNQQANTRDFGFRQTEAGRAQGNTEAERTFRATEAARAQGNTDRGFGFQQSEAARAQGNTVFQQGISREGMDLQRRQDERAATAPVTLHTQSGSEISAVRDPNVPGGFRAPTIAGQAPPSNPFASDGRMTAEQSRAAGFSDRMFQSEDVLRQVSSAGADPLQRIASGVPGIGNFITSQDRQRYEQAQRDFINAQLRRESGAAISPSEFESARQQYFPQPGDERNPQLLAQKERNRQAALIAMAREGGQNYRPGYSFTPERQIGTGPPQSFLYSTGPKGGARAAGTSPAGGGPTGGQRQAAPPGAGQQAPQSPQAPPMPGVDELQAQRQQRVTELASLDQAITGTPDVVRRSQIEQQRANVAAELQQIDSAIAAPPPQQQAQQQSDVITHEGRRYRRLGPGRYEQLD